MEIRITTEFIRLDSLLKLCDLVSSGGEAKVVIQSGLVSLNGEICTERGRKLRGGEEISYKNKNIKVLK